VYHPAAMQTGDAPAADRTSPGDAPEVVVDRRNLATFDGTSLGATTFVPESPPPRRAVVLASATGVMRKYYAPFARYLAEDGCAVVTFDYRGIGDSRPDSLRGFAARMHDWGERDLESALRTAIARWPDLPLGLVVHSVGGQVAGLAPGVERVDRMVSIASQSGWIGLWPWWFRPYLRLLWFVLVPVTTGTLGYFPSSWFMLGEPLPSGVAREWASWCKDPDYLFGARFGLPVERYSRIVPHLLAWSFADDGIAPPRAVADLLRRYASARVHHRHVDPQRAGLGRVGHFGFFRDRFRDSLWRDTREFLVGGVAPRPSMSPANAR
jgi:predicted alpha/beta hydrolase